jgi:DNA-binding beta-propeller fold protein YncE
MHPPVHRNAVRRVAVTDRSPTDRGDGSRAPHFSSVLRCAVTLYVTLHCAGLASAQSDYTAFEEGHVRPLALSADGTRLFALNSPDDTLEIFAVGPAGLSRQASVHVGMRPVALAVRSSSEVWVVNHLSDSISVVDVTLGRAHVTRTLWVGDEPRDIVFAGPQRARAFVTTAHRGQNSSVNPQLTTPGVGRADVWVFDAGNLGSAAGGTPLRIVTLFSDTPRALAASPDGTRVYAAAFYSGNQTTVLEEGVTPVPPETNAAGVPQPTTAVIAKFVAGRWREAANETDVTHLVNFTLPDYDVFTLDAMASPPRELAPSARFTGVGTTLFNMAVNPQSGALYVTNIDADNFTRLEPNLRGDLARSRITVIDNGVVTPIHLNKHIDYSQCCAEVGSLEARKSLALPRDMAISADGSTLYVTAFGSSKIGVFDTAALESDGFTPSESSQIEVGGGPSGIVLDERLGRLYVLTRFDNSVAAIDLDSRTLVSRVAMFSPEPAKVVEGRPFLYDALNGSSHGDSACASCHIDGDMDHLAWDLGDPTAATIPMPGTANGLVGVPLLGDGTSAWAFSLPKCSLVAQGTLCAPDSVFNFNSLKGALTTQTLKGMDNHGPMHWRGDRSTGTAASPGAQPNTGMFNEATSFAEFNVAFVNLLGRDAPIATADMTKFGAFALELTLPPNPIRNLDNSFTTQQQQGRDLFFGGTNGQRRMDPVRTCNGCHKVDPLANSQFGVAHPGFFGTDGRFSHDNESQFFKVPQLRNIYQKVGMFGVSADRSKNFAGNPRMPFRRVSFMGDQVRGYGFNQSGVMDTIFTFLHQVVFTDFGVLHQNLGIPGSGGNTQSFRPYIPPGTYPTNPALLPPDQRFLTQTNSSFFQSQTGDNERRAVEAFLMAFPSNMAPVVGQQVTLRADSGTAATNRLTLLKQRAAVTSVRECDLVAKAWNGTREVGYLYVPSTGRYRTSASGAGSATVSAQTLETSARTSGREVTFTCVPPGNGVREALDRDRDGSFDGVELSAGTDPADPNSHP